MEGDKKGSKDDYNLINKIGKGAYGTVYKALDKKSMETVAVKVIELETDWLPLLAEINMVIGLRHPSIVNYHTYFFESNGLWLVMEYCDGGSLSDIMKTIKRPLKEIEIAAVLRSVMDSLVYVHRLNRIHRDIKAGNLLLTSAGIVKLCDFGVSAQLDESITIKTSTVVGSPYWMAPEIMSSQKEGTGYDKKVDIWSVGITALELLNGNPPYHDLPAFAVLMKTSTNPPPEAPSTSTAMFKDFIKTVLIKNPDTRPSADEVRKHPFLNSISDNQAADIIRDLVNSYIEAKSKKDDEGEYEEEEGYEEEEEEEEGYEEEDEMNIDSNQAATILYGEGTFVASTFIASGTMVSSDTAAKQPSALADYKPEFLGEPSGSGNKLKQAQKRHFKNFTEKDLNYMLASVKQLALNNLREGKIDPNVVRENYEDVRKGIVQELQRKKPEIPNNYEALP